MSRDYTKIPLGVIEGRKVDSGIYNYRTIVGADGIDGIDYRDEVAGGIRLPIRDQGGTGACLAFSQARVMEIQHYMETGEIVELSPGYIYYLKTFHDFSGMSPIFDLDKAVRLGTVLKEDFDYLAEWHELDTYMKSLGEERKLELAEKANRFRAKAYINVDTEELPAYLHHHHAAIITVDIYQSFYKTGKDGIVPLPEGKLIGGHAMETSEIKIINGVRGIWCDNQWGEGFGKEGRVWIALDNPCIQRFYGLVDATPKTSQIVFLMGTKTMYTSTGKVQLPIAPVYVKDENGQSHAMFPARAFAEWLGRDVTWEPRGNGQDRIAFEVSDRISKLLSID